MSKVNETPDFLQMADWLIKDASRYAAVTGLNFFKESFQNQGFTDEYFEEWSKRKNDLDPGRKILIRSAFLMNSVQVFNANAEKIEFGSDAEYADLHNNGGDFKITVTQRARKFFWFMYKKTQAPMWKAMALTKKDSFSIKIPARPFVKHSQTLMYEFDD